MTATAVDEVAARDREADILDAVLVVLARDGIRGVSMRAVATEAGVSLGLASYYFNDKTSLVAAALRRIGEQDLALLDTDPTATPAEQLRSALRRIGAPEFLEPGYLSLRLQLWSLATIDAQYDEINRTAQTRYRDRIAALIRAARPQLSSTEAARRAAEILVLQNGVWLTAAIVHDPDAAARTIDRCERIAFAPEPRRGTR